MLDLRKEQKLILRFKLKEGNYVYITKWVSVWWCVYITKWVSVWWSVYITKWVSVWWCVCVWFCTTCLTLDYYSFGWVAFSSWRSEHLPVSPLPTTLQWYVRPENLTKQKSENHIFVNISTMLVFINNFFLKLSSEL